MGGRHLLSLLLLTACGGLSCAVWEPLYFGPSSPSGALRPSGPDATEWIEGRFTAHASGLSPSEIREVAHAIAEQSERNGLERELVLAVIRTESGFSNFARSHVGALGLMQIMPRTGQMLAAELGIPWENSEILFDPVINVTMGTRYLATLHAKYGSWDRALAAYNWGPRAIDRRLQHGRRLPVRYSTRVLAQLQSPATP
jgi:soluble lytic murein transglycosylase-like protein